MKRDIILTVGSMTHAIKAKKILNRGKISVSVIKLDSERRNNGCGYGIVFSSDDEYSAIRLLKENKIPYLVYEKER